MFDNGTNWWSWHIIYMENDCTFLALILTIQILDSHQRRPYENESMLLKASARRVQDTVKGPLQRVVGKKKIKGVRF